MNMRRSIAYLRAYIVFDDADLRIVEWMRHHGIRLLRFALGVIFIWFGLLKIVGTSPATQLVASTVYWANPAWFVPLLGLWEILIGVCFLFHKLLRVGILILVPQMIGTFLPLVLLPSVVFQAGNPFSPTLEGQYIIKNLIIITAAIVVGSTVRDTKFDEEKIEKLRYSGNKE
jgi:uncharacterized membrane protein YkgB